MERIKVITSGNGAGRFRNLHVKKSSVSTRLKTEIERKIVMVVLGKRRESFGPK